MTEQQLKERDLINAMSMFIVHLTQGSMTAGDRDLVIDNIIYLTRLLNEYKLDHNIVICDADLWENGE
jgi:hypothetical protein